MKRRPNPNRKSGSLLDWAAYIGFWLVLGGLALRVVLAAIQSA